MHVAWRARSQEDADQLVLRLDLVGALEEAQAAALLSAHLLRLAARRLLLQPLLVHLAPELVCAQQEAERVTPIADARTSALTSICADKHLRPLFQVQVCGSHRCVALRSPGE